MKGIGILSFLAFAVFIGEVYGQAPKNNAQPPPSGPVSAPPPGVPAAPPTGAPVAPAPPASLPGPEVAAPEAFAVEPVRLNQAPPGFQNTEGYNYDPTGKRDPFKPYGASQTSLAPEPEIKKNPEPLEMYDVSQFRLVGVIWNVRDPKAMVKDPVGKLHMLRKETKIGRNNGFVAAIREGEIIVVEPTVGENGMQTAVTRVLNLKP